MEEATPAKSTPVEATLGATPIEDAHTEGRNGDASPMEGVHGRASLAEEELEEAMPDASVGRRLWKRNPRMSLLQRMCRMSDPDQKVT